MSENNVSIYPVRFGDNLYLKTAKLAQTCSFQGSGQFLCELMLENFFTDYEQVFAACINNCVIGFCVLANESCVDDNSNYPWLDFLFVTEKYRNQGIAGLLIKKVVEYAHSLSFKELFLCTANHEKFYQKFGFKTIYDDKINEQTNGKIMKLSINN